MSGPCIYLLQGFGQFAGGRFCSARAATGGAKQHLSSLRSFGYPCSFSEQPETVMFPPHFKVFAHWVNSLCPETLTFKCSLQLFFFSGGNSHRRRGKKKEKKMSTIFYTGILINLFLEAKSLEFFML